MVSLLDASNSSDERLSLYKPSLNLDSLVLRYAYRCASNVAYSCVLACVDTRDLHLDLVLLHHLKETLPDLVQLFVQAVLNDLLFHFGLLQSLLHTSENLGVSL